MQRERPGQHGRATVRTDPLFFFVALLNRALALLILLLLLVLLQLLLLRIRGRA